MDWKNSWPLLFLFSCSTFNAGTVHLKYLKSTSDIQGVRYENKNRLKDVSASIRSLQHPGGRGMWDFNVRLSPSLHFDNITYVTGAYDPQRLKQRPPLRYKRLSLLGNLKFSFHSPLGDIVLSGGYGGSLYRLKIRNGSLNTLKTGPLRKIDLVWVGFLTKRVFLLLGPRYYKDRNEQYYFAFRVGYFWGDVN